MSNEVVVGCNVRENEYGKLYTLGCSFDGIDFRADIDLGSAFRPRYAKSETDEEVSGTLEDLPPSVIDGAILKISHNQKDVDLTEERLASFKHMLVPAAVTATAALDMMTGYAHMVVQTTPELDGLIGDRPVESTLTPPPLLRTLAAKLKPLDMDIPLPQGLESFVEGLR